MSYSNSGYVLGYPIEKITLETYDKFVQEDQRSAVHVGYNVLAVRICSHGAAKRRLGEYG